MNKKAKADINSKLNNNFRDELKLNVSHKLDEINHYISGCDSPFTHTQISDVQCHLVGIADILGIR